MTERVDHAAEARKHIEWAHEQQERDGEYEHSVRDNVLIAQAEATLALVEQQKVANLLALWALPDHVIDSLREDIAFGVACAGIRKGLGL